MTQYREGIERIDVVARAVPAERLELDRLPGLTIATTNGVAVPLSQVARFSYEYEEPILWRRNRDLVLTARATSSIAAGARRQQGGQAEAQASRTPCPSAIASRPAARSRKASRRTSRSPPCSR